MNNMPSVSRLIPALHCYLLDPSITNIVDSTEKSVGSNLVFGQGTITITPSETSDYTTVSKEILDLVYDKVAPYVVDSSMFNSAGSLDVVKVTKYTTPLAMLHADVPLFRVSETVASIVCVSPVTDKLVHLPFDAVEETKLTVRPKWFSDFEQKFRTVSREQNKKFLLRGLQSDKDTFQVGDTIRFRPLEDMLAEYGTDPEVRIQDFYEEPMEGELIMSNPPTSPLMKIYEDKLAVVQKIDSDGFLTLRWKEKGLTNSMGLYQGNVVEIMDKWYFTSDMFVLETRKGEDGKGKPLSHFLAQWGVE